MHNDNFVLLYNRIRWYLFEKIPFKSKPQFPVQMLPLVQEARTWVHGFVNGYNEVHRHSGIRFVTPAERHNGSDHQILAARKAVYETARQRRPERWRGETRNWSPVGEVWLNPEKEGASNSGIRGQAA